MKWWFSSKEHPKQLQQGVLAGTPLPELQQAPKEEPDLSRVAQLEVAAVASGKKNSFFDMIPEGPTRKAIESIAKKTHATMGGGRTPEEFRESVSLCWLVRRRIFEEAGKKNKLHLMEEVRGEEPTPIVALTRSGSILALSEPDEKSWREVGYWSIHGRDRFGLPEKHRVGIVGIRPGVGCTVYAETGMTIPSATIIGIYAHPKAKLNFEAFSRDMGGLLAAADDYVLGGRFERDTSRKA